MLGPGLLLFTSKAELEPQPAGLVGCPVIEQLPLAGAGMLTLHDTTCVHRLPRI